MPEQGFTSWFSVWAHSRGHMGLVYPSRRDRLRAIYTRLFLALYRRPELAIRAWLCRRRGHDPAWGEWRDAQWIGAPRSARFRTRYCRVCKVGQVDSHG